MGDRAGFDGGRVEFDGERDRFGWARAKLDCGRPTNCRRIGRAELDCGRAELDDLFCSSIILVQFLK
jgi:hypothetical protein